MAEPTTTRDIVAKLWNLCHILRDDGVTYNEYVTELTFLLFLKMLAETGRGERLPERLSLERTGQARRPRPARLLQAPACSTSASQRSRTTRPRIFTDAQTTIRKPTNLKALTDATSTSSTGSRRARKGSAIFTKACLEKNAAEKKSGAGQYFTPRPLIDCMVRLMKPQPGEIIQDPAAGTAGFLVAADHYIKDAHRRSLSSCPRSKPIFNGTTPLSGWSSCPTRIASA